MLLHCQNCDQCGLSDCQPEIQRFASNEICKRSDDKRANQEAYHKSCAKHRYFKLVVIITKYAKNGSPVANTFHGYVSVSPLLCIDGTRLFLAAKFPDPIVEAFNCRSIKENAKAVDKE